MPRPNILYLHSHDTGRYVQPYGHAIPTPNIQRLAEQGVLFRQCFCAAPTCSPSRAALLTGQCAHSAGMLGLVNRGFTMESYDHHLVNTLRTAGYHSALSGIQHVAKDPALIGYDEILAGSGHDPAPAAAKFLSQAPAQPFFLSVGFFATHRVFPNPSLAEDPRYCLPPAPFPDTPETRRDMAAFKTSARTLDHGMGAVLAALDANNLADNTLVICTTDHGIAFPGMKCHLTDHGIGVMLIMRGPGGFAGGKVCDAMVSQIDLFPTLCELVEIEPPDWLQGNSMMPLIRVEEEEINDEVFAEVTYHAAYEPQRCVRTRRWKYIRRYDDRGKPFTCNCDDSPSKTLWLQCGWRERVAPAEQLYDLVFDPHETHSMADDPSRGNVLDDMRGRLDRWMADTDDPLLQGPAPLPAGAIVSPPDDVSPRDIWKNREQPKGYS